MIMAKFVYDKQEIKYTQKEASTGLPEKKKT